MRTSTSQTMPSSKKSGSQEQGGTKKFGHEDVNPSMSTDVRGGETGRFWPISFFFFILWPRQTGKTELPELSLLNLVWC